MAAELVANPKADVLIAPAYDAGALELFAAKRKNMRVLEAPAPTGRPPRTCARSAAAGWSRSPTVSPPAGTEWRVVTKVASRPTSSGATWSWPGGCARWVKSNAIVLAAGGMAVGIGGGQQNRVTPGEIAAARAAGRAKGGAAASDAFFPFRDGLDAVAAAGVAAVIQPGGSLRDDEVIAAADEHGIAMVFTGERQFRH